MRTKISLFLLMLFSITGCGRPDPLPTFDYLLYEIYDPESLLTLEEDYMKDTIRLFIGSVRKINEYSGHSYIDTEKRVSYEKLDSIRRVYRDYDYNRPQGSGGCVHRNFKLDITSDTDFDATHPAGSNINDVFKIKYGSPKRFIEDRYTVNKSLLNENTKYSYDMYLYTKTIDEFNSGRDQLIFKIPLLWVYKAPAQTSTHRFTITYTDEDGKVLTTTTAPITLMRAN